MRLVYTADFSLEWYISSQQLTEQGFCLCGAKECMKRRYKIQEIQILFLLFVTFDIY